MYNQAPDLPIYLEKLENNRYRGTIYQQWNTTVNLIRKGYKFVTDDGGYGTISDVNNLWIYIDTDKDLLSLIYAAGTWKLYVPTVFDISKFIPEPIDQTKLIPELLATFQGEVDEVDDSILRLNYSKDYNKTSNELLYQTLGDLGIKFYEDVSVQTLRRLVQESIPYYIASGRLLALDYIGLSLGVDLRYEQLWTYDYKHFFTKNEIPLDYMNNAYPTNYVRIYYDDLGSDIDESVIRDMFYQLAWICNIIYDIVYATVLETAQEYSNIGLLLNEVINFKNKDAEMQAALDEDYLTTIIYPRKVIVT